MTKDFDVDSLKVHRIAPRDQGGKAKRHLPVAGVRPTDVPDVDEAFGGDERTEVRPAEEVETAVIAALKTIFDPEIPLNVYDLGLIYGLQVDESGDVEVSMTLTAPACPVAGQIVTDVATRVGAVPSVRKAHVKLVWDPPWTKDRMSEEALLELGLL